MPNNKIIFIDEINLGLEQKFEEEQTLKALHSAFPSMDSLIAAEFSRLHARHVVASRLESLREDCRIVGSVNVSEGDSKESEAREYLEFCARYPLVGEISRTLIEA